MVRNNYGCALIIKKFNIFVLLNQMNKLLLFLVLLFTSCFGYSDGYPCDGPTTNNTQDIYDSLVGTYYLSDSTNFWTERDSLKKATFVNDQGFKTEFSLFSKYYDSKIPEQLNYKTVTTNKPCGNKDIINLYNYARKCNKVTKYTSNNLDFYYQYQRYNTLQPKYYRDSIININSEDHLTIFFSANYKYNFGFNVNFNKSSSGNCIYNDTITLRGKLYSEVYNYQIDTTKINKNYIQPIGLYLNKEIGLIGFYFNNGEKWLIE